MLPVAVWMPFQILWCVQPRRLPCPTACCQALGLFINCVPLMNVLFWFPKELEKQQAKLEKLEKRPPQSNSQVKVDLVCIWCEPKQVQM